MEKQPLPKALIAIVAGIAAMLLCQAIASLPAVLVQGVNEDLGMVVYVIGYNLLTFLAITAIIRLYLKDSLGNYGLLRPALRPSWVLVGLSLPLVTLLIITLLVPGHWGAMGTDFPLSEVVFGLIIYTGFMGSVIEEVVYHGLVYPLLRQRLQVAPSAIITGIIFALSHMVNLEYGLVDGIVFIATASALSIFFAYITEVTGSVWNAAWAHVAWNILATIISVSPTWSDQALLNYVVADDIPIITGGSGGITTSLVVVAVMAAGVAVTIWTNKKAHGPRPRQ